MTVTHVKPGAPVTQRSPLTPYSTALTGVAPATDSLVQACLAAPELRGFRALQAKLVDRIKRAAIVQLHASARGERLLLRMYHDAEEASQSILIEQLDPHSDTWMMRQIRRHLDEEQAHTALFAAALDARGAGAPSPLAPSGLSRRKLARWRRLAHRHAPYFSQGVLVPAYATALCAEQMAVRIMHRHCDAIGPDHALHALFAGVLADEHRHVRLCAHTLLRLVAPHEAQRLALLLAEVRSIDAAFGISGALFMYGAGLVARALPASRAR